MKNRSGKINNSGFTIIELVLLVIIVSSIGIAGIYVYRSRANTNTVFDNTAKSINDPQKLTANSSSVKKLEPKNFVAGNSGEEYTYNFDSQSIIYKPVAGWKITEKPLAINKDGLKAGSITLTSPDYVSETNSENDGCMGVSYEKSGKAFYIEITQDDKNNPTQDFLDRTVIGEGGFANEYVKTTKISGQTAITYAIGPGECYMIYNTQTVYNGFSVDVTAMADTSNHALGYIKQPYFDIYESLVASVKLK